jgi:hypothetical protein
VFIAGINDTGDKSSPVVTSDKLFPVPSTTAIELLDEYQPAYILK